MPKAKKVTATAPTTPNKITFIPTVTQRETVGVLYFIITEDQSINEEHVPMVRSAILQSKASKLFLVIDSVGGVPYSAVRIMRVLRKRFKEIHGVVPHKAMSAATLMMFGTNTIYMSEESQLGPLDLPMEHPVDGSPISALDVVQALSQLESTAIEFATKTYKDLRSGEFGERIGREKAVELALEHAGKMVRPLLEKIDPYHRQKALRKLKIGRWYAIDLLLEAMMPSDHSRAGSAASKFVTMFPDHSYGVFREDARSCELKVLDSEALSIWDILLQEANKFLATKLTTIVYNEIQI